MTVVRAASSSSTKPDRKRAPTTSTQRIQLHRFLNWQRSAQQQTAALVRLIRLLAR